MRSLQIAQGSVGLPAQPGRPHPRLPRLHFLRCCVPAVIVHLSTPSLTIPCCRHDCARRGRDGRGGGLHVLTPHAPPAGELGGGLCCSSFARPQSLWLQLPAKDWAGPGIPSPATPDSPQVATSKALPHSPLYNPAPGSGEAHGGRLPGILPGQRHPRRHHQRQPVAGEAAGSGQPRWQTLQAANGQRDQLSWRPLQGCRRAC